MTISTTARAGALAALLVATACGGGPATPETPESKTESKVDKDGKSASAGPGAHDIPDDGRVPSVKLLDRRARTALASNSAVVKAAPAPKSSSEVYRDLAPATVIIRTPDGLGSGVVIDKSGWVLTNHHVVRGGETKDFNITVSVLLGAISKKSGAMERVGNAYKATVFKADKLRDMALIKIENPPKDLKAVKLSSKSPVPGDSVLALGHAGAGMLWALKSGEISALGKLSEQLALLAKFKKDDKDKEAADSFRKFLDKQHLGYVIQSTCNILPGDSGGPLVSRQGELVGINAFSRKDGRTGGLLSFHVHLDEIKKFVKDRPKEATPMLPSPWEDGGGDAGFADADLDGRIDVLLLRGRRPCLWCPRQSTAIFVDANQDSYTGRAVPSLTEAYDKKDFDAELAFLQLKKDTFIWYDRNNDGIFDVLLYDKGGTGRVTAGYKLGPMGGITRDDSLAGGRPVQAALMLDDALRERLERIAAAAFPARYTSGTSSVANTLPEPIGRTGDGRLRDLNKDGRSDSIFVQAPFSSRLIIDADQSFVPALRSPVKMAELELKPDAEVVSVSQGSHVWVWYDTDDDRRFDLVLHAPGIRDYVAVDAWSVDASGNKTRMPEHEGRKLMRPSLMQTTTMRTSLLDVAKGGMLPILSALENDGIGSFPDPTKDHRGAGFTLRESKELPKGIIAIQGRGSDGFLIDLDQNSFRAVAKKKIEAAKAVKDGKVEAEFGFMQRNGLAWAFYDTKNTGKYDVVVYTPKPRRGLVERGFRIDKNGKVTLDETLAGKHMIRPSLFKSKRLGTKFRAVAEDLFSVVEE